MRTIRLTYIFILLFSCLQLQAGIIHSDVAWKKKQVHVCWWNGGEVPDSLIDTDLKLFLLLKSTYFQPVLFTENEKTKLKDIINKNFQQDFTGISFTGWNNCEKNKTTDVIMFGFSEFETKQVLEIDERLYIQESKHIDQYFNTVEGRANLAMTDMKVFSKTSEIVRVKEKSPRFAIFPFEEGIHFDQKMTFLHEFSHLAGLAHEHYHLDAIDDERCHLNPRIFNIIKKGALKHQENLSAKFTSVYDPYSITNYCYETILRLMEQSSIDGFTTIRLTKLKSKKVSFSELQPLSELNKPHLKLSKGDLHALRCLYKKNDGDQSSICHENFDLDDSDLNLLYKKYLKLVL